MKRREDNIGFGDLRLIQDEDSFCYGTDAVLLADMVCRSIDISEDMRICDLGCNTGIISLILSAKCRADEIVGVEVQEQAFELAKENALINHLTKRLYFVCCNVKDIQGCDNGMLQKGSFDIVTTNPPYTEAGRGIISENKSKAIARHEILASLDDFFEAAAFLLKDKGQLFMVHRPARIVDICESCRKFNLEPKTIRFVSGKPGELPNILLIHFVKGGKPDLKWLSPISVRNEDGSFSKDALSAYELY